MRVPSVALAALAVALSLFASRALAQGAEPKVGVVNMNKALNVSEAGERSKKVLLTAKSQKENALKAKEDELKRLAEELRSSIMLTEAAKAQKEKTLREKENGLRQEVQDAQRDLQEQERKLTESIFKDLRSVIATVSKEQKLDFVLEQGAAQAILFSRYSFVDITDEVIARYNKPRAAKG